MDKAEFEKKPWFTLTNSIFVPLTELSIGHCGYEIKTDESYIVNTYPSFRLHYIVKGSMFFYIDGKEIFLPTHSCFLIRPDVNVSCKSNPKDPASHYWISFNGQEAKRFSAIMGFSAQNPTIFIPEKYQEDLHNAFYSCLNFPKTEVKFTDFIFLENFMKISKFLAQISNSGNHQPKKVPKYIEQALIYFEEHYTEPEFTVASVAKALFIHENYLSTIFKAHMGISFKHYLGRRRTDLALSLINQGYTSICKIATMVGVPDPSYFSKFFKRHNGKLPSEEIKIAQKRLKTSQ